MIYAITYDLKKIGQDYNSLYGAIKQLGNWCHPLQNLWFSESKLSIDQVRDYLRKVIDANDFIFVCEIYRGSYSAWMPKEAHDWLEERL